MSQTQSRTHRIPIWVTSVEKDTIESRAIAHRSRSTSSFLRSLGLKGELDTHTDSSLSHTELKSRFAELQADLFSLKFLLEAELGVDLSRPSQEIEASEEPIAFHFAVYAEKLQSLYLNVMRQV